MSESEKRQCPDCGQMVAGRMQRWSVLSDRESWASEGHNGPCGHPCMPAGCSYPGDKPVHYGTRCIHCQPDLRVKFDPGKPYRSP